MPKPATRFVCQSCGTVHARWVGRCEGCGEWNTLAEEALAPRPAAKRGATRSGTAARTLSFVPLAGESEPAPRTPTGIAELDRVLGGGLVPAAAMLVGGDPGIGKSTLLLQAASAVARAGRRVLYITGEESIEQVRLRALRLGLADAPVELAAAINLGEIAPALEKSGAALVVIDSIQTMWLEAVESAPGTVNQVRASGFELTRLAKTAGFSLVLVGHMTKDGMIAGPRVLEHMVDAVLTFEGDRGHQFRILRAVKNRFGATDEIGVFEMTDRGLAEVANPSAIFLAERRGNVAGSAVFAGIEGTRPVLLEVQALLAPNGGGGAPRRAVVGWDGGRLAMLLAVLEARAGLPLGGADVYLNIAGGLRITEPAADLAVAAAVVSAASSVPTAADTVYFGEVGLSGEVRQVAQAEARLKEAAKLGFAAACLPRRLARGSRPLAAPDGLSLTGIGHLSDLVGSFRRAGRSS
ncbi:MAG TPA: DNA repair protein RadA [Acetobacteraceae bacterium]|nr:DNA repair protein RadA [Acetobacteraceae bacterium]